MWPTMHQALCQSTHCTAAAEPGSDRSHNDNTALQIPLIQSVLMANPETRSGKEHKLTYYSCSSSHVENLFE